MAPSPLSSAATPVVRAVVEAVLAAQFDTKRPQDLPHIEATTHTLIEKLEAMAPLMGQGMLATTLLFDAAGRLRGGRRFRGLPLEARQAQLKRWRHAPIGVFRDFTMFFEKMSVFVFYCFEEEDLGEID